MRAKQGRTNLRQIGPHERRETTADRASKADVHANGKPHDHPFTDIVVHRRDVYSPRAANLVREIDKLCDDKTRDKLADLLFEYNDFANRDVKKLEAVLTEMRDKALQEARERGFET
jgi:hypothetical protein